MVGASMIGRAGCGVVIAGALLAAVAAAQELPDVAALVTGSWDGAAQGNARLAFARRGDELIGATDSASATQLSVRLDADGVLRGSWSELPTRAPPHAGRVELRARGEWLDGRYDRGPGSGWDERWDVLHRGDRSSITTTPGTCSTRRCRSPSAARTSSSPTQPAAPASHARRRARARSFLRDAWAEDDASCPAQMRRVTFSCRMTAPADHGSCSAHSTRGSGDECLGSQSCCLPPRATKRVLAQSRRACKIRECGFLTAGLSAQEEESLCPAREAGAQCTLPPETYPSLKTCARSPLPLRPLPSAHHDGVWKPEACLAFGEALDAAERKAGEMHARDHATRLAAEDGADGLPRPQRQRAALPVRGARALQRLLAMREMIRGEMQPPVAFAEGSPRPILP
jgi:hypothetical protein